MPSLPSNACKECGHVNEGERVYCHNCGTKLDRSALLAQQQEEPLAKKRKRIKKMMKPGVGLGRDWWKTALKALFCAAAVAAVIDAALPPASVPPTPNDKFVEAPELGQALETVTSAPNGMSIALTADKMNGYLWNSARVKPDGSWLQAVLKFQRVFVELEPGALKVTLQNTIYNYPLYVAVDYRFSTGDNALTATPVGASIGRLQFPRELVPYLPVVLQYVNPPWDSLKRERALMDKLQSVQITKDQMILTSRKPSLPAALPPKTP